MFVFYLVFNRESNGTGEAKQNSLDNIIFSCKLFRIFPFLCFGPV